MKIGLFIPFVPAYTTPALLIEVAQAAERLGFHSLWAPEHVLLFDEYASQYPYAADGRLRIGSEPAVLEPFTLLAYLASATSSIRIGTGICLVPQRNPVYTAKEVATVDFLSNGRLDFGVGIGWLEEEFEALGVPWARRGQRARAYIEVMKRLWCDPVSSYEGEFYRLAPARQYPKPVQQPHPPIHFGGVSNAALRRVADLGQGWYGFGLTPDAAAERIRSLAGLLEKRGRRRADVFVSVSPGRMAVDPASLDAYRDAGVQQVIVAARGHSREEFLDSLSQLAEAVVQPAAAL